MASVSDENPAGAAPPSRPVPARPSQERSASDARRPEGPHADGVSGIEEMVTEIRTRLSEISTRELELRRREHEFARQYHRLEHVARRAAEQEVEQDQERLEQRSAELHDEKTELRDQETELTTLRARLEHSEQQLRQRELDLHQQRSRLARQTVELQARGEQQRERQRGRRRVLRKRIAVIRRHERELASQIEGARNEIAERRSELERQTVELERRATQLAERERALQTRQTEFQQRRSRGHVLSEQARARDSALAAERTRLEERCSELENAGTELDARADRLREQTAELEANRAQLADVQAQSQQREATLAEVGRRMEEVERQARQLQAEALALREQAEARDDESRQTALTLELQRQWVERERAALESATRTLDQTRSQSADNEQHDRAALTTMTTRLRVAEESLRSARGRWWLRGTILSLLAAVLAGGAWLTVERPLYRAQAEIAVAGDPAPTEHIITQHCRALRDPELLADHADPRAEAWRAACAAGRVTALPGEDQSSLRLRVAATDARIARELVVAAAETYIEHAHTPGAGEPSPQYLRLAGWRDKLAEALQVTGAGRATDALMLATVPRAAQREHHAAEAERMQAELANIGAALQTQRARLATLLAGELPRGSVDPAAVEDASAQDTVYQEDRDEFAAVALQHRTELAVSMLVLTDPAKRLQRALLGFMATVTEQRELDPPAEVSAVLEACETELSRSQKRLAAFREQWRARRAKVQALSVDTDVVALVQHQNDAADAARRLADDAVKLVEQVGGRIAELSADGRSSTREVVVGAVLRGDHANLQTTVEAFAAAAAKTSLSDNFELDSLDRKLRGLRMRLNQRREALEQRLQLEADRAARQGHAARVDELRGEVRRLEERREELLTGLIATIKALRGVEADARRRDELESRVAQQDQRIAWLREQLSEVEQTLGDTPDRDADIGRLELSPPVVAAVPTDRFRNAGLVAFAAFAATWLLCALMAVRLPGRRRAG